ncbi:MAG: PqqD family peptide modification chaperone [Deltaproteobacteria bacterium]|nr:MAG: PqqD family peptide modification chaperone [Deltaproteobacteria bacterium]
MTDLYDLLVVGAGPIGLSTALLARRRGLRPLVIDRGTIANHLLDFPLGMPFFGPAHSLELAGIPLDIGHKHATREDLLSYYGRLARLAELEVHRDRRLDRLEGRDGDFTAIACAGDGRTVAYRCRKVVLATGVFGRPRRLPELPGVDLPKVGYLYREPYSYIGKDVLLVGAGNSSAGAALALHHAGARVTVLDRNAAIPPTKWRWYMEDLQQLVHRGEITLLRRATLERIEPDAVWVNIAGERVRLANDAVLVQLGYEPDAPLFDRLGIGFDPATKMPRIDVHSFETDVRGVYLAGIVCAGTSPDLIFVWGARNHPRVILAHILGEPPPPQLRDLGRTTVAHWVQFEYLSDDIDEALALRMVPVVAGEIRDDVFDVYEYATHTTSLYTDGPRAELTSTERWKVGPVLDALGGWLVQRNADGSGVYKGQTLSANAFEILRLCDGTRRISGVVEALAAQYEQSEDELRGPVLKLILSLLYTGRLHWRATPAAAT